MIVSILMSAALLTVPGQETAGQRAEVAAAEATSAPLTEAEMGERLRDLQSRFPDVADRIRAGRPNAGHRRELRVLETDLRKVEAELAAHAAAFPDSRWADFDIAPAHIAISILDFELTASGVPR